MKKKEINDIKTKEVKELEKMISKLRIDLMKNAVKIAGGKEKNIKKAWNIKKEIAQILTILKTK